MASYIPEPVRDANNCHHDLIEGWLPPYGYRPSLAAGVTFCVLFGLVSVGHVWKILRFRTWTAILLAIGALSECSLQRYIGVSTDMSNSRDDWMGRANVVFTLSV